MRYYSDKVQMDEFEKYRGEGRMSERNRTLKIMWELRWAYEAKEKAGETIAWKSVFIGIKRQLQKSPRGKVAKGEMGK